MMARSPSRNMPIASALTAKPFTDGSVVARSRADSSRLAPSASGSSTPPTPQQESALESHHEHTIEMLFAHLKRILKLDRLRLRRSDEHTSDLQSLMRTSYAVFCLKKKK